jgi:ABC-type transport system involved in multi-copper enzyme maturation permease subunit
VTPFTGVFGFELGSRLRRISTYVYAGLFFVLAFLTILAAGGGLGGARIVIGGAKVLVNSPYSIAVVSTVLNLFGILVIAAVAGRSVQQDFEHDVHPLLFSRPLGKRSYLGGRFAAACAVAILIFAWIPLGIGLASTWPFLDAERVGAGQLWSYLHPFLVMVLPNIFVTGAIFFSLAALTRRILPTFASSVVLLSGYAIAGVLLRDLDNRLVAGLLDPFGLTAIRVATEYWTIAEKNTLPLPLDGVLLLNRLLWLAVGAAILFFTHRRFSFSHEEKFRPQREMRSPVCAASTPRPVLAGSGLRLRLAQLLALSWQELRGVVKSVYFLVIVLAGVLFMLVGATQLGKMFDTTTYPVTYMVLEIVGGSFGLFMVIIITVYAGEAIWRERGRGVAQIIDATPVSSGILLASKLLGLAWVQALLMGVVMVFGVATQLAMGYTRLELSQYLVTLFLLHLPGYLLLTVLAVTVQVVANHKYVGHAVMVTYYILSLFMSKLGLEHKLYHFGDAPHVTYSDMNGYGPFLAPHAAFSLYWAAFALILALLSRLLWVRGMERGLARRLRRMRERAGRGVKLALAAGLAAFLLLGTFVYYNTNVLNTYRTRDEQEALRADYEKRYRRYRDLPQPRIAAVKLAVDIYPERRALSVRGSYRLDNRSGRPIERIHLDVPEEIRIDRLAFQRPARARRVLADRERGHYIYRLAEPLPPGGSLTLAFDLAFAARGFENSGQETAVAENGTFFNNEILPHVGYDWRRELRQDRVRRRHGLKPRERMADINDRRARMNTYFIHDADRVSFDAVLSTRADQIAITSGALKRTWQRGGRRYFHYRAEGRILDFAPFLSARYAVKRDRWRDVEIAIYHHPGHEYNVARMIRSVKRSLDYYTRSFGPYQHSQVRIVEFPRYQSFAQSFPGTIPYSESIGFIARVDLDDPDDVDYPFYVTAHEVAHQWWAHQVIGGNVQGATLLSESLAQYSALMVMEKEYGRQKMQRFLRHELHGYLHGRSLERKKEMPLLRVENQQYIHYNKGSLVFYALRDYIGEQTLNRALARYIKAKAYQDPPYTNALELLETIREVTPKRLRYLLEDMFETITLYDNRARAASARELADGRWEVKLRVQARKLRADEQGREQAVPMADWIDIGVLDSSGRELYLKKHRLDRGDATFTVTVDRPPARAGIDPYNKLIDRKSDDNVVDVKGV